MDTFRPGKPLGIATAGNDIGVDVNIDIESIEIVARDAFYRHLPQLGCLAFGTPDRVLEARREPGAICLLFSAERHDVEVARAHVAAVRIEQFSRSEVVADRIADLEQASRQGLARDKKEN